MKEEKPRERLLKYGVENLSNEDLLSIILKTGIKNIDVRELSKIILSKLSCIEQLKEISLNNLMNIKGIGQAKGLSIISALELGRRVYYKKEINNIKINNSDDIYNYFKYIINDNLQEMFYVLYLDIKKNIIDKKLLFIGTVNMSTVHPREIFKYAYINSASFIICIHNHPSGDINPSKEDILLTKELVSIGITQKIPILDHIIIGDNNYYSFYKEGLI